MMHSTGPRLVSWVLLSAFSLTSAAPAAAGPELNRTTLRPLAKKQAAGLEQLEEALRRWAQYAGLEAGRTVASRSSRVAGSVAPHSPATSNQQPATALPAAGLEVGEAPVEVEKVKWTLISGIDGRPFNGPVRRIAFNREPELRNLAVAMGGSQAVTLDWEMEGARRGINVGEPVLAGTFSGGENTVLLVFGNRAQKFNPHHPQYGAGQPLIFDLPLPSSEEMVPHSIAFSPDRRLLLVTGKRLEQARVQNLDPKDSSRYDSGIVAALKPLQGRPISGAFQPNRRRVALGTSEGTVELWHLPGLRSDGGRRGEARRLLHSEPVESGAPIGVPFFSFDGKVLATGDAAGNVRIWERKGRGLVPRHTFTTESRRPINSLAFLPSPIPQREREEGSPPRDNERSSRVIAAAGEDGAVRYWDVETGRYLARQEPAEGTPVSPIQYISFSPDGEKIAAGRQDKMLAIAEIPQAVARHAASLLPSTDVAPPSSWGYEDSLQSWLQDESLDPEGGPLDGSEAGLEEVLIEPGEDALSFLEPDGLLFSPDGSEVYFVDQVDPEKEGVWRTPAFPGSSEGEYYRSGEQTVVLYPDFAGWTYLPPQGGLEASQEAWVPLKRASHWTEVAEFLIHEVSAQQAERIEISYPEIVRERRGGPLGIQHRSVRFSRKRVVSGLLPDAELIADLRNWLDAGNRRGNFARRDQLKGPLGRLILGIASWADGSVNAFRADPLAANFYVARQTLQGGRKVHYRFKSSWEIEQETAALWAQYAGLEADSERLGLDEWKRQMGVAFGEWRRKVEALDRAWLQVSEPLFDLWGKRPSSVLPDVTHTSLRGGIYYLGSVADDIRFSQKMEAIPGVAVVSDTSPDQEMQVLKRNLDTLEAALGLSPSSAGLEQVTGYVVVGGMAEAVPAAGLEGRVYAVTVGLRQTEAVLKKIPPSHVVAVAAGPEEAASLKAMGIDETQLVHAEGFPEPDRLDRALKAAIELAKGILRWIHDLSVQILDARGRSIGEIRLLLEGLPPAWQEGLASGLEQQILQLDELSGVGV